ncbi:MAG: pilus assembly protein PilM [Candidatus Omnitrophica bacterium]|nr:pilus assembly protein PilM [Candidatus Omnitrophota bacterium]
MKPTQLFNNFFGKETQDFVGINLGSYYVKGVIVRAGRVTDYFIKERKELPATLKQIWQEKNISTNKVKLSVKDHSTLVRYFNFPKVDKKKIKQTLFYELNKHIPFSPEEVFFDFAVLEENPSDLSLLLAVAKKELINSTIDIFEKEKKEILDISLDSICLVNVFLNYYKEEKKINTSILDIGYAFSTLTVIRGGIPFMTRDLTFGTKDILSVISHVKNIPAQSIDKWVSSPENHREMLELSQDNIAALCREVKSSFDYFEVNKGERIEKVFLTGGLSSISGIEALFKEYLECEVLFLDNLLNLKSVFTAEQFNAIKNTFSVSSGIVL